VARILVVGAAGFLAGHLIPALRKDGHVVTGMDLVPPDGLTRLRGVDLKYVWKSVSDLLPEDLAGVDTVIYLAAQADVPLGISSPTYTFQQNVLNVVHYMHVVSQKANPPRTLYTSSESVYGVIPRKQQPITEETLPNPTNVYGVSKFCAESVVRAYAAQYGLRAQILRSTTMFGEASRSKQVVPIFIRQALAGKDITVEGDGSQSRDFNYVGNMVHGIQLALANHVDGTFNIGSGLEVSIKEMAEAIIRLSGSSSQVHFGPWRPGEQGLTLQISIDKAREQLGYVPQVRFAEGLSRTIAYWSDKMTPADRLG
jgi:nucleoside-diphosphate-sugar epimerase